MTPWPGTYGAPRLLGPTPDSQSFYQKANPEEEEAKSFRSTFLFLSLYVLFLSLSFTLSLASLSLS